MQLAMIGLGRMGASMVRRLLAKGHECVVYDVQPEAIAALQKDGATGATTLAELAAKTARPRAVWMMVPAAIVDGELEQLLSHLDPGDIVIDGGNSYYRDDVRRAAAAGEGARVRVDGAEIADGWVALVDDGKLHRVAVSVARSAPATPT